jgi:hypothetical protein
LALGKPAVHPFSLVRPSYKKKCNPLAILVSGAKFLDGLRGGSTEIYNKYLPAPFYKFSNALEKLGY